MDPVSYATSSNREKRREVNEEDIKHLLAEVWDFDPDKYFYKMLSRESKKGVQDVTDVSKEELKEEKWREDNCDLSELMTSDVVKIRSLKDYITHLTTKEEFTSEANKLRCNTITLDDWENFICYPNRKRLLESTREMSSNPSTGLAGSSGSSSTQLTPVE